SIVLRHNQAGLADTVLGTPGRRSEDHPPDPEMAEGGCAGRGPVDRDDGGYTARLGHFTAACQCVSPLRLRSLGPTVAHAIRDRRYDRREVRGRHDRWLPTPRRCEALSERPQRTAGTVHAEPAPG